MFASFSTRQPAQPSIPAASATVRQPMATASSRRRVSFHSRRMPPLSPLQRQSAPRQDAQGQEVGLNINLLLTSTSAEAPSLPSQRHEFVTWAWLWATCSVVMASYYITLGKGIAGGDSGEIVAEACQFRLIRFPRNPLLTILQFLFVHYLPLPESPAWKANLLSAICTTLAAGCLFLCVVLFGRARHRCYHPASCLATTPSTTTLMAAAAAAGLFVWSPQVWQSAVTAEAFALNNALLALLVYTTLRFSCSWTSRDRRLWACTSALLCGLALTNQHRAILFEIPLVLYLTWCLRRDLARRPSAILFELGGWFVCGLLPYINLLLISWWRTQKGSFGDLTRWQGWEHWRQGSHFKERQPFQGYRLGHEAVSYELGTYAWDLTLRQGLKCVVPFVALAGFVAASVFTAPFLLPPRYQGERAKVTRATDRYIQRIVADLPAAQPSCVHTQKTAGQGPYQKAEAKARHESRQVTMALGIAWVLSLFFFDRASLTVPRGNLNFSLMARPYMQANLLVFMWAGVGLDWLACVATRGQSEGGIRPDGPTSSNLKSMLVRAVCVVLAMWQFHTHFAISDQHANTYFNQYARSLLAPLPPDAVLLMNHGVQWTSLQYMQKCEGFRTDVTILNLSVMASSSWELKQRLYSGKIVFPGTYYVSETHNLARAGRAFTARGIVDANIDRVGGMFVAGNLTFSHEEVQFRSAYTALPMGLSVQLFKHEDVLTMRQWLADHLEVWRIIQQRPKDLLPLAELPAPDRYPEGTWEFEIRRDYFSHLAEAAAHALEEAIVLQEQYNNAAGGEDSDGMRHLTTTKMSSTLILKHFLDAAWWLEVLVAHDAEHTTHTLKNLGLAYLHLLYLSSTVPVAAAEAQLRRVPRTSPFNDAALLRTTPQWFRGPGRHEADWRLWVLNRFDEAWSACLERPDFQHMPEAGKMKQQHQMLVTHMRPLLEEH